MACGVVKRSFDLNLREVFTISTVVVVVILDLHNILITSNKATFLAASFTAFNCLMQIKRRHQVAVDL
jgi:hypothetical protein